MMDGHFDDLIPVEIPLGHKCQSTPVYNSLTYPSQWCALATV